MTIMTKLVVLKGPGMGYLLTGFAAAAAGANAAFMN